MKNYLFVLAFVLISITSTRAVDEVRNLQPQLFWRSFSDISQIPRCSSKEKRIREEYIQKWAQHFQYRFRQDSYGNSVVEIPPSPGKEGKPKLVLQSHLDMVCEKNQGSNHNFEKDPLKLLISERDWVIANQTTLGADDAAGIAMSIAMMMDPTVVHGPIELLFTIEEEIGLVGAQKLEPGSFVTGTVLINIDSGSEGQLTIGCAGGMRFEVEYDLVLENISPDHSVFEINVKGLTGGHSGKDINSGKGNSIKIMARILKAIYDANIQFELVEISAGTSANAIPREFKAQISLTGSNVEKARLAIQKITEDIKSELIKTEPNLFTTFNLATSHRSQRFGSDFALRLINVLQIAPHGVVEISRDIPNLVETSLNFAAITEVDSKLVLLWSIRSSIESAKDNVASSLRSIASLSGAKYRMMSNYPGWRPNFASPIIEKAKNTFKRLFNRDPEVKAVHAGLEPGVIGSKYPQLAANMISIGPNIIGNHSPTEKMQISSVARTYQWVKELINEYAK